MRRACAVIGVRSIFAALFFDSTTSFLLALRNLITKETSKITSNNAVYQSDDGTFAVRSGAITVTGENGGFEQSVTRFDIGYDRQSASAILDAVAGLVSFVIEHPRKAGFSGAVRIGVDGTGEQTLLNGASVISTNEGYCDAALANFARGSS